MGKLDYSVVWPLSRRFLAEVLAAFFANITAMFSDESRKYEAFVKGFIAGCAVYMAIYTTFPVSGAQINPMTTLAVVLSRRMPIIFMPFYLMAQFVGTFSSLALCWWMSPLVANATNPGLPRPGSGVADGEAIVMEIIITFFLELAIVALLDELRLPSFHCLNPLNAFVLLVMVLMWIDTISGPVSGACSNPIRSLAASLLYLNYDRQYIYLIGPPIGSALSVLVQECFLSPDACKERFLAFFNFCKPFNRRFYYNPKLQDLNVPIEEQNANAELDYYRLSSANSSLSFKWSDMVADNSMSIPNKIFPPVVESRASSVSTKVAPKVMISRPSRSTRKKTK